ncbi:MAG TPA: hypothetical protein VFK13_06440 [Gemmatimonadaceae bacterium]|nr:hypothetical protein [Gemmatimonadaceae bacterium]
MARRDIAQNATVLRARIHGVDNVPALGQTLKDPERLVREHADGKRPLG